MLKKDNPLKILIINYEHPPLGGGGGVSTQNLAWALVEKGHTVHILTTGARGLAKTSDDRGVTVYRVPVLGRKDLQTASNISMLTFPITSIPKGLALCLKHRYDVINTHFYAPSGPTGMLLSLLTRIPNALYIHGADVYDPTRLNKTPAGKGLLSFLLRISAKIQNLLAENIACQSSNTRENIEKYIKPKKPVTIIPLPFIKPPHPRASRKELGLDPRAFYLLSAGRAVERKGYNFIIRALQGLDSRIHLIIIGDGPELPSLSDLAKELGVSQRVHLLGYVEREEDKYKYFTMSDLYVLSSLHEGMGIVLQEAMEFGLPVVATNHGGQVDLIKHGINGLLVPPGNVEALAEAIKSVCRNKAMQTSFGKKNSELIKGYYANAISDTFLELFKKTIEKKNG